MSTTPLPPPAARNTHLLSHIRLLDQIEVWWPYDREYYPGKVAAILPDGRHRVHYDDGEVEELQLSDEQWRFRGDAAKRVSSSFVSDAHAPTLEVPSSSDEALLLKGWKGGGGERGVKRCKKEEGDDHGDHGNGDDDDHIDDDDDDVPVKRVVRNKLNKETAGVRKTIVKKRRSGRAEEEAKRGTNESKLVSGASMPTASTQGMSIAKQAVRTTVVRPVSAKIIIKPSAARARLLGRKPTTVAKLTNLAASGGDRTGPRESASVSPPGKSDPSTALGVDTQTIVRTAAMSKPIAPRSAPTRQVPDNSSNVAIRPKLQRLHNANVVNGLPQSSRPDPPAPAQAQSSLVQEGKSNSSGGETKKPTSAVKEMSVQNSPPLKTGSAARTMVGASQFQPGSKTSAVHGKPNSSPAGFNVKQRSVTQGNAVAPLLVARKPDAPKLSSADKRRLSASVGSSANMKSNASPSTKPSVEAMSSGRPPPEPRTLKPFAFVRRRPLSEESNKRGKSQGLDVDAIVTRRSPTADKASNMKRLASTQQGDPMKRSKENSAENVQGEDFAVANSNGLPQTQTTLQESNVTGTSGKADTPEVLKKTVANVDVLATNATTKSGPTEEGRSATTEGEGALQSTGRAAVDSGDVAMPKSFCRIEGSGKGPVQAGGAKDIVKSFNGDDSSKNVEPPTEKNAKAAVRRFSGEHKGSFSRMAKKPLPRDIVPTGPEKKATSGGTDTTTGPCTLNRSVDTTPARESRIAENQVDVQKDRHAVRESIAGTKCTPSTSVEPQISSSATLIGTGSLLGSTAEKRKQTPEAELLALSEVAVRNLLPETASSSPKLHVSTTANCENILSSNTGDSQRQPVTNSEKNATGQARACNGNIRADAAPSSKEGQLTKNDATRIKDIGDGPITTFKGEAESKPSPSQYMDDSTSSQGALALSQQGRTDNRTSHSEDPPQNRHVLGKRVLEEEPVPTKRPKLIGATRDSPTDPRSGKMHASSSASPNATALLEPTPTMGKTIKPCTEVTATGASMPMSATHSAEHIMNVGKMKGTLQSQPQQVINPRALHSSTDNTSSVKLNKETQQVTNRAGFPHDVASVYHGSSIDDLPHKPGKFAKGAKESMAVASAGHGRSAQSNLDVLATSTLRPPTVGLAESQAANRMAIESLVGEPRLKCSRMTDDVFSTKQIRERAASSANVRNPHSLKCDPRFTNANRERHHGQENCDTLELSAAQTLQITEALRQAAALNENSNLVSQPTAKPQALSTPTHGFANASGVSQAIALHKTLTQSSSRPSFPTVKASAVRKIPHTAPTTPNATVVTQQQSIPMAAATLQRSIMKSASSGRTQDGHRRPVENRPMQRPASSRQSSQVAKTLNPRLGGHASAAGTGMPRSAPSSAGKIPFSGRVSQDAEKGTASLPLDILMRSITESNWRALQKGLGPLSNCIAINHLKTEERLNRISADLSNCLKLNARLNNNQDNLAKLLGPPVSKNSLIPTVGTITTTIVQTILAEINQTVRNSQTALSREVDAKLKLLTEPLVAAVQRNTDAIQGLHCKIDRLITTAVQRGLESLFTSDGPSSSTGDSHVGAPSQDVVGDTGGNRAKQSNHPSNENIEESANAGACLSSEKMAEYENIALKARELTGRAIVEWMIYGGARDRAPENERQIAVPLEWVKETSKVGITEALAKLEAYKKFEEALADLKKIATASCIEIAWLVSGPTEDSLRRARRNYSEWDPQLRDFEWESEKRVLFYTAKEVLQSERELLAKRNRIRDPLLCSIRCLQITRIRATALERKQ